MRRKEDKTQIAILEWLSLSHPPAYHTVIKIDNEGKRHVSGHITAIKAGLHKYASDLFIAWPTISYFGLFMEVKPDGWKGPRNKDEKQRITGQKMFLEERIKSGYQGTFVIGVDQGILALKRYLNI